eukprot:gene15410-21490_t
MPNREDLKKVLRILKVPPNSGLFGRHSDNLEALCIAVYKALDAPRCETVKTGTAGHMTIHNKSTRDLNAIIIPAPTSEPPEEGDVNAVSSPSEAPPLPDGFKVVAGGESDSTYVNDDQALVTLSYEVHYWQTCTPDIQSANKISLYKTLQLCTNVRVPVGHSIVITNRNYTYTLGPATFRKHS